MLTTDTLTRDSNGRFESIHVPSSNSSKASQNFSPLKEGLLLNPIWKFERIDRNKRDHARVEFWD